MIAAANCMALFLAGAVVGAVAARWFILGVVDWSPAVIALLIVVITAANLRRLLRRAVSQA
jgi:hypothetical protein